jgi:hypothetical protein
MGSLNPQNVQYGKNNAVTDPEISNESKKYAYSNNYKEKNPMTRTQWRRYQRSKKGVVADFDDKDVDPKGKKKVVKRVNRKIKERLSLPRVEENVAVDDEMDSDFIDS